MLHLKHYNKLSLKSNHKNNGKIFERERERECESLEIVKILCFGFFQKERFSCLDTHTDIHTHTHTHTHRKFSLFFTRKKWDDSIADLQKTLNKSQI